MKESDTRIKTGNDIPRRFSRTTSWDDSNHTPFISAATNKLFQGWSQYKHTYLTAQFIIIILIN